jgi:uncharacterized protein (TIGR03435 family)
MGTRDGMSIAGQAFLVILRFSTRLPAQSPHPKFEVATLKLSPPPESDRININLGTFRNGRLTLNNVTLNDAIKVAYELVSDDQLVGPAWNREVRFDIEALAPVDTPPAQLHLMTQDLLAERLHLVLRREQKVLRYLALVIGKGGPKFRSAKPDVDLTPSGTQVRGRISHNQISMQRLVSLLSRFERQTIVDHTALRGLFEVTLEWAPDSTRPADDLAGLPSERPSLFAAVQEQLGLRLEPSRGPLEVLVVEQASRVPEAN